MLKNAKFHSARLCFIPFFEIGARRMGTMVLRQQAMTDKTLVREIISQGDTTMTVIKWDSKPIPGKMKEDTRVVMADVIRTEPAVNLPEWALAEADIETVRNNQSGLLLPADRREMERLGKVFDPSASPDEMLNRMTMRVGATGLTDNTEFAEPRVKRVYYPVWRIKYVYQNRPFSAGIDAVTGKLMSARAPQSDKWRIVWMIVTTAVVAFLASPLIRGSLLLAYNAVHEEHFWLEIGGLVTVATNLGPILIPVLLVGAAAGLAVIGFGWDRFRYPGEIAIAGKNRSVIRVNRPEKTRLDQAGEWFTKAAESWFQSFLRGGPKE
jgi:hypothetical protein